MEVLCFDIPVKQNHGKSNRQNVLELEEKKTVGNIGKNMAQIP